MNADLPMLVTLSGIVTLVSLVQSSNAVLPMLVTLSGIFTLVSPEQPSNAESPMLVTLFEIIYFVIELFAGNFISLVLFLLNNTPFSSFE